MRGCPARIETVFELKQFLFDSALPANTSGQAGC